MTVIACRMPIRLFLFKIRQIMSVTECIYNFERMIHRSALIMGNAVKHHTTVWSKSAVNECMTHHSPVQCCVHLSVESVLFWSFAVARATLEPNMSKVTSKYFGIIKLKWNKNSLFILVSSKIPLHKFSLSQPDLFLLCASYRRSELRMSGFSLLTPW